VIIPFYGWVATWDGTVPWVDLSRAGEIEEDINKNIKEKTLVIPVPFFSKHCGYIDSIHVKNIKNDTKWKHFF
jgi:hypothetical protein